MPGFLLTANDSLQCLHGGQARPASPMLRVRVNQAPVVTQAAGHLVTGCAFNVSGAPSPCVNVSWTVVATRVRAGGLPVLLADSQAVCAPNGTGVVAVPANQRVKGM